MIAVIDYKAGNAPSVLNALKHLNIPAMALTGPEQLNEATHLILPGVGSAAATMESLTQMRLIGPIKDWINGNRPFLGICIGLQVLFEHSAEGDADCLGILPGTVTRFDPAHVRVPQMGWNAVRFVPGHPLAQGLAEDYFYFVNSYYAQPADPAMIGASTEYGLTFPAMIWRGNLHAAQFHMEKSGEAGLRLLQNFANL